MRFAGEAVQGLQEDRPVVPGFNPDDLQYTPELPEPTLRQQYQRDNYILREKSGVAMNPLLLPAHVIRGAVQGQPTGDGTLPELKGQPDPFQQRNKIRPSDSDDQLMDIMKSGFVQSPQQVEVANLFNPLSWFNGKNQKDIEKMNSGSSEEIEQKGIGGVIMNRNRRLNRAAE